MCPNLEAMEWATEGHIKGKILLVLVNGKAWPVSNNMCPLCNEGWNNMDTNKIAIRDNVLHHASCLRKSLNNIVYSKLIESQEIIEGLLS